MRVVDGNEVGAKIQAMYIRREIDYGGENEFCRGMRKALRIIEDAPAVEAITREQYHDMTERFFDEFVDNGANEETVAKCMFIGLAFGKLELMLFGENEDGDTCN